jgi:hypothetical protein
MFMDIFVNQLYCRVVTNSIGNILPREKFEEPAEVRVIKAFVLENYQQTPEVTLRPNQIVIQVKSAALAGALRMRLHELAELCETEKKLILRIG